MLHIYCLILTLTPQLNERFYNQNFTTGFCPSFLVASYSSIFLFVFLLFMKSFLHFFCLTCSCLKVILEVLDKLLKPDINALLHEFGFQVGFSSFDLKLFYTIFGYLDCFTSCYNGKDCPFALCSFFMSCAWIH